MNKKDYTKIASVIKGARGESRNNKEKLELIWYIIRELEKIFQNDNEKFDASKFENAIYE